MHILNKILIGAIVLAILVLGFGWKQHSDSKEKKEALQAKIELHKKEQEQYELNKKMQEENAAKQELNHIHENEQIAAEQREKQKSQIELIEIKIKDKLIDPDSAKFRNQKGNCGEVNSKNRMGGYIGFSRYVYYPSDDRVMIESDSSDSIVTPSIMNSLWAANCQ